MFDSINGHVADVSKTRISPRGLPFSVQVPSVLHNDTRPDLAGRNGFWMKRVEGKKAV